MIVYQILKIMKKYLIFIVAALTACEGDDPTVDTEYPTINKGFAEAFPVVCSELERGKTYTFKARFTDNQELGSYSFDIHNDFNHHNHTGEVKECSPEPEKVPVKPMLFVENYTIPAGLKEFEAKVDVVIPADVDIGDYHFVIKLTDQSGWASFERMSLKIK